MTVSVEVEAAARVLAQYFDPDERYEGMVREARPYVLPSEDRDGGRPGFFYVFVAFMTRPERVERGVHTRVKPRCIYRTEVLRLYSSSLRELSGFLLEAGLFRLPSEKPTLAIHLSFP